MTDTDTNKAGLKFWIAALAFSVLLLALTFAILASYLAEIKSNTSAALMRTDLVTERLNILDTETAAIHRHMMEEKAEMNPVVAPTANDAATSAPAPSATNEGVVQPLVKDITPPSMQGSEPSAKDASGVVPATAAKIPAIEVPSVSAPAASPSVTPTKP